MDADGSFKKRFRPLTSAAIFRSAIERLFILTLKKLVVVVGGMTGEAGAKFSLILREPPNGGRRQRVKVDLKALVEGTAPDIPLKDDDIIIVP